MTEYKVQLLSWRPTERGGEHAAANTAFGRYKIERRNKRLILLLNERIIGIHSDPAALRRLAEADLKLRTEDHEARKSTKPR